MLAIMATTSDWQSYLHRVKCSHRQAHLFAAVVDPSTEANRIDEDLIWPNVVVRRLILGLDLSSSRHQVSRVPALHRLQQLVRLSLGKCRAVVTEAGDVHAPNRIIVKW